MNIPTFRYCLKCKGVGGQMGISTWMGPGEWEDCPACMEEGFCPRCLKRGWLNEETGKDDIDDVPCKVCGWDWNRGEMDNQIPKKNSTR
jgi:hypothetical protein